MTGWCPACRGLVVVEIDGDGDLPRVTCRCGWTGDADAVVGAVIHARG